MRSLVQTCVYITCCALQMSGLTLQSDIVNLAVSYLATVQALAVSLWSIVSS